MNKLPEEEIQRRISDVRECLSRSPELTKDHFVRCHGYGYGFLKKCEEAGIVFGKSSPQKRQRAWRTDNPFSTTASKRSY